jgi:serine/threonine-protein phosphatase PGAM5
MKNHAADDIALCDGNLAAAWAKYVTPTPDADTHDLLVCHGNVIRWMVAKAMGSDSRTWTHMDIANASLTVISVRPDGTVRLVMYSDVGHMPVDKQTWAGRGAGWDVKAPKGMK